MDLTNIKTSGEDDFFLTKRESGPDILVHSQIY